MASEIANVRTALYNFLVTHPSLDGVGVHSQLLPQNATGSHVVLTFTGTATGYDQGDETQGYAEASVQVDAHADGYAAAAAVAALVDVALRDLSGVQGGITFYVPERIDCTDLSDREGERIVYWISTDYLIRYLEDF